MPLNTTRLLVNTNDKVHAKKPHGYTTTIHALYPADLGFNCRGRGFSPSCIPNPNKMPLD